MTRRVVIADAGPLIALARLTCPPLPYPCDGTKSYQRLHGAVQ